MVKNNKKMVKSTTEVGTPMGGKTIPVIKADSKETVTVKGTKTMKKQKATWY